MSRTKGTSHTVAGIVLAASFGFVVVQLDVTIVNVALPAIGQDLKAGVAELQWVVDAYALVFAALLLSAGVIGDRLGSRQALSWLDSRLFALASLCCGLAPNGALLIAARGVQGIGAALLVPSSLALLNHASGHDAALRARMVGAWTAAGGVSIAAGPIFGGLLLAWLGWRTIFLVNLPVCAFAMLLTWRTVPKDDAREASGSLDPLGQLLAILALGGLVGAVIEARPLGMTHWIVLTGAALAIVAGGAFIWIEGRSPAPMLPLKFFRRPNFSAAEELQGKHRRHRSTKAPPAASRANISMPPMGRLDARIAGRRDRTAAYLLARRLWHGAGRP